MKHWIVTVVFLFSCNAIGQTEDLDANQKGFSNLTQAGKLFQVEIKPTEKDLQLFLTGVGVGGVQIKDATVEASIGSGDNQTTYYAQKVKDPKSGRFFYKLKKRGKKPLRLKIRSGDNTEDFSFPPPN